MTRTPAERRAHAQESAPAIVPENDLEARLLAEPGLLEGLAWGRPRSGHPEGTVAAHVADLLGRLDRAGEPPELRRRLRLVVIVHDSFKYRVSNLRPKTGANHHAARARRFAERFIDDEGVLATIDCMIARTPCGAASGAPAASTSPPSTR